MYNLLAGSEGTRRPEAAERLRRDPPGPHTLCASRRASLAHVRQSRPHAGLAFQVRVLTPL